MFEKPKMVESLEKVYARVLGIIGEFFKKFS